VISRQRPDSAKADAGGRRHPRPPMARPPPTQSPLARAPMCTSSPSSILRRLLQPSPIHACRNGQGTCGTSARIRRSSRTWGASWRFLQRWATRASSTNGHILWTEDAARRALKSEKAALW